MQSTPDPPRPAEATDELVAPLLTYDEVADILSASRRTVRRLVLAGELVETRFMRHPRITPASVRDLIRRHAAVPPAPAG